MESKHENLKAQLIGSIKGRGSLKSMRMEEKFTPLDFHETSIHDIEMLAAGLD